MSFFLDMMDPNGKKTDMVPGRYNSVHNSVPMATLHSKDKHCTVNLNKFRVLKTFDVTDYIIKFEYIYYYF